MQMRSRARRDAPRQAHSFSAERHPTRPAASQAAASARPDVLSARDVLELQRVVGNAGVGELLRPPAGRSPVLDVVASDGGRPLEHAVRQQMERGFGHDFGEVRVHSDARATQSARSVSAHAYVVGDHVVFQSDLYRPETPAGRRMLAHELAHVVQQRSGPVTGTRAPGGIRLSDPSGAFEIEADRLAHRALRDGAGDLPARG
jgi:Domain of unknown function (DUF4157)